MSEFLKNLQDALLKLLPSGLSELAFEGVGAVILIVVVVLAFVVFKTVTDAVGKGLGEFVKKNSRAAIILIFALAFLAPLGAKRPYTAIAIAVLALLAAIVQRRWQVTPFGYALLVIVVGGISLTVEGRIVDHQRRKADEQLTVYVVLPFQPAGGVERTVLLDLSASLRNTIEEIFGTLTNVKVQPEVFVDRDLDDLSKLKDVETRLTALGLSPDVVLQNRGMVMSDPQPPAKYVNLLLRPRFYREGSYGRDITACGFHDQMEFLAIRASLELLAQMKQAAPQSLSSETETAILRNAANEYLLQLKRENHCPNGPHCAQAMFLANDPAITLAKAIAVTNAYPPDTSSRMQEIRALRLRSHTAKLDWLPQPALPPPPPAAPPGPPAVTPEVGL